MARLSISAVLIADKRPCQTGAVGWGTEEATTGHGWIDVAAGLLSHYEEVLLVADNPPDYLDVDALIVGDHYRPAGLLSGIHAGLFAARHSHAFVTAAACGVLPPAVIDRFKTALAPRWDAVLIERGDGVSPLPGVYHKRVLKPLAQQLKGADERFEQLIHPLRIGTVRID